MAALVPTERSDSETSLPIPHQYKVTGKDGKNCLPNPTQTGTPHMLCYSKSNQIQGKERQQSVAKTLQFGM